MVKKHDQNFTGWSETHFWVLNKKEIRENKNDLSDNPLQHWVHLDLALSA